MGFISLIPLDPLLALSLALDPNIMMHIHQGLGLPESVEK